jgi:hypothetical protein
MAQLVGLDCSKQKPYLQRNQSDREWKGKIRGVDLQAGGIIS